MAIQRTKYTGDPGLFGSIFGGLKKVAGVGLGLAAGLPIVGGAATIIRNLAFPGDARINIPGASTFPSLPMGTGMPQRPQAGPGMSPGSTEGCPPWQIRNAAGFCAPGVGIGPLKIPLTGQLPCLGIQPGPDPVNGMNGMNGDPMAMRAGTASGWPGYHWNKSDYFLRSGEFVPAGSKSVKNRRRNPMNPRATSNAITRVKGAKRFAASLSNITIRKKC